MPDQDPHPPTPVLDNSAREALKGTLVPVEVGAASGGQDAPPADEGTGGLSKFVAIRQLALEPGDTERIRERLAAPELSERGGDAPHVATSTLELLAAFEEPLVPALQPDIAAAAGVSAADLETVAQALVDLRAERLRSAQAPERESDLDLGQAARSLNTAIVAQRGLALRAAAPPLGMLNLERIEMVPNGIQRGELVSTIPLAPGEETAVTHKEWSVTSKEFTTIVTDSLEEVSETGVTDNTDLSQSTSSQSQHSNQVNITGTVQGGIPVVSGSSTAGFTAQDSRSKSATESIKHARAITEKASSRSRREHKVTISTTTETGTSETSTRTLRNNSQQPIRIDYFSLMRKWRVRLYRYGLRLTYDIVVPEPGAAMRRAYADLASLRAQQGPFVAELAKVAIFAVAAGPAGAGAVTVRGIGSAFTTRFSDCAAQTASRLVLEMNGAAIDAGYFFRRFGLPRQTISTYDAAQAYARNWFEQVGIKLAPRSGGFGPVAAGGTEGHYVVFFEGGASGGHVVYGRVSPNGIVIIDNQLGGRTWDSLMTAERVLGMQAKAAYRVEHVTVP